MVMLYEVYVTKYNVNELAQYTKGVYMKLFLEVFLFGVKKLFFVALIFAIFLIPMFVRVLCEWPWYWTLNLVTIPAALGVFEAGFIGED